MKLAILKPCASALAILVLAGCDPKTDADPQPTLIFGSFEGTLPNGYEIDATTLKTANGVVGSTTSSGPYLGRHILSLRDSDSGWNLSLELPPVAFTIAPPGGELSDPDPIYDRFREEYSYELVKERLLEEKQKANADAEYSSISLMRLSLNNQLEYYAYLHDHLTPAQAGKLRVMEVVEGTEIDQQGQSVRKIEVLVEMELNMKATNEEVSPQQGVLTGLARFKYREDFDQTQFIQ